jgi:hypothetical protein
MNIIFTIVLLLVVFIAVLLIMAFFMRNTHFVSRQIIINAPQQKVFDYIKLLKNQENFNSGAMTDPDRAWEHTGTDGTIGYLIAWKGNKKAGEGQKEIINIIEGKTVETEIRFVKPMVTSATIIMDTESLSENQTKVAFSNAGTLPYPFNVMIPVFEKMFAKDMDKSLLTLQNILEN